MADDLDTTAEDMERESARAKEHYRKLAAEIPAGEAGDCDLCGELSLRLVRGACAPCRDRHKLK